MCPWRNGERERFPGTKHHGKEKDEDPARTGGSDIRRTGKETVKVRNAGGTETVTQRGIGRPGKRDEEGRSDREKEAC